MIHRWRHNCRPGLLALRYASCAAVILFTLLTTTSSVRSTNSVDLLLVLALDSSASVDDTEFALQSEGIAYAFRHPTIINAILRGRHRRIAVTVIQWAGVQEQSIYVPWTVIADPRSAAALSDKLSGMARSFRGGGTYIAGAIQLANTLTGTAPFAAARRVVDISGDGINTVGNSPHGARDAAIRAGITINGLAIINENIGLADYYRLTVIGGPGAFVVPANDYNDYARAILEKLLREIDQHFIM